MEQNPFILLKKKEIEDVLAAPFKQGKNELGYLKSLGLPFNILAFNGAPINESKAEIHKKTNDLFFCLSGKINFICGGELVDPLPKEKPDGSFDEDELRAKEIKRGRSLVLNAGDWLWVPAGIPHKNGAVAGHLAVVKIPLGEK